MKLLDAAEVEWAPRGGWEHGWDGDSRVCGGLHVFLSECDPEMTADVIGVEGEDGEDCGYRVVPFGIMAEFIRPVRSARDDDAEWLAAALKASAELPVSRGLLVRQGRGPVLGDTWLGSPEAFEVPAPAGTDGVALGDAISEGRAEFFRRTLGIQPILHVNPDYALQLARAQVIDINPVNGEVISAWGDPVVISEGYYDIEGQTPTPPAFWTGPIKITLSEVNTEEITRAVRQNKAMHQVTMIAAIDTAPCAIIRIGAAPAPAAP